MAIERLSRMEKQLAAVSVSVSMCRYDLVASR